jgi:DNA-binding LacI/PurR family transcriptional regulator
MMMLLGETRENAEREHVLIENLLDRRVAGVILAPGRRSVARTLPVLRRSGVAVTVVDRMATAPVFDQVGSDGQEPMAPLVDHLARHGHRRIALVAGIADVPTTHERLTGYSLGLARNALPTDRCLVVAGYDDFEWSGLMSAPLTAVAQDWSAIGRCGRAADAATDESVGTAAITADRHHARHPTLVRLSREDPAHGDPAARRPFVRRVTAPITARRRRAG